MSQGTRGPFSQKGDKLCSTFRHYLHISRGFFWDVADGYWYRLLWNTFGGSQNSVTDSTGNQK